jgi:hypothetical protein
MRQRPIAPFVKIPNNDPDWNYAGYDFSDFAQEAARVSSTLNADNPDLSAFRDRGGKLIIDNGDGWIPVWPMEPLCISRVFSALTRQRARM